MRRMTQRWQDFLRQQAPLAVVACLPGLGLFCCTGTIGNTPGAGGQGAQTTSGQGGATPDAGSTGGGGAAGGSVPDGGEPDSGSDAQPPVQCAGTYAYLHGDLWPMWYNMRVACDPEHKALWRCERAHGSGAAECAALQSHYQACQSWASPWPCLNWGVCAPTDQGNDCGTDIPSKCDTTTFNYDDPAIWGSYYGLQWGSSTDLHRFLTIHIRDSTSNLIIAFSARPQSGDAYMDGLDNFGVGPAPQGLIQLISGSQPGKYEDKFGSFACIQLPAGEPLQLWAAWMNDFCHTCSSSYESYPNTPCNTELTMTFEAGKHYLWTEQGIELMAGCSGPPPEILARLPAASCSTEVP